MTDDEQPGAPGDPGKPGESGIGGAGGKGGEGGAGGRGHPQGGGGLGGAGGAGGQGVMGRIRDMSGELSKRDLSTYERLIGLAGSAGALVLFIAWVVKGGNL